MSLKNFYNERNISIGYATLYIYKKNGIANQCLKTLALIKDLLLNDSSLLVNFWDNEMDSTDYLCNRMLTKCSESIFISKKNLDKYKAKPRPYSYL